MYIFFTRYPAQNTLDYIDMTLFWHFLLALFIW